MQLHNLRNHAIHVFTGEGRQRHNHSVWRTPHCLLPTAPQTKIAVVKVGWHLGRCLPGAPLASASGAARRPKATDSRDAGTWADVRSEGRKCASLVSEELHGWQATHICRLWVIMDFYVRNPQ